MRILLLSDSGLNPFHGTGSCLCRNFHDYPQEKLMNLFWCDLGEPTYDNYLQASRLSFGPRSDYPNFRKSIYRFRAKLRSRGRKANLKKDRSLASREAIQQAVERFNPDLIYSTACDINGLWLLERALQVVPKSVPVVQHFLDFHPLSTRPLVEQSLKRLSPRLTEVWSLSKGLVGYMDNLLQRETRHYPLFSCDIDYFKQGSNDERNGTHPKAVLTGNIWLPEMACETIRLWHAMQDRLLGLNPIEWYCNTFARQSVSYIPMGSAIRFKGFANREKLNTVLQEADVAVLPFNPRTYSRPEDDYTYNKDYSLYSLPSKLTEYCAVGLPVVCFATADTEVSRFVTENEIGVVLAVEDIKGTRDRLFEFLTNRGQREQFGRNARKLAERDFNQPTYLSRLLEEFSQAVEAAREQS